MAKCDEGYLCEVCGQDVADIRDSDLYLRFVIGEIDARQLMTAPERHLRCTLLRLSSSSILDSSPLSAKARSTSGNSMRRMSALARN